MKAVFIDAVVNFKFCLPPYPLSFSALIFILCTAVDFLQGTFCLPVFLLTFTEAMSSITFLTFELKESRRRSIESAVGLHDISFQHRYRDVRIRNSHIAGCAMFSRPILFVIYSGYGKYSDPLKFFTLFYIAAIC